MKETMCWYCTRPGTGGCAWDKSLTPVEGWTAERSRLRLTTGQYTDSYFVVACPLFQPAAEVGREEEHYER